MNIDGVKNGIVIDHITPGKAMQLYHMLGIDKLDCCVAVIQNVASRQMGKKDMIKIDASISINLDVIGYVSPNATINTIEDGKVVSKAHIDLPSRLTNIIYCKNPRCITTTEQEIDHVFVLSDKGEYRCLYCETESN